MASVTAILQGGRHSRRRLIIEDPLTEDDGSGRIKLTIERSDGGESVAICVDAAELARWVRNIAELEG